MPSIQLQRKNTYGIKTQAYDAKELITAIKRLIVL
jgi:hypothetical protein